jgi:hypothetical protein
MSIVKKKNFLVGVEEKCPSYLRRIKVLQPLDFFGKDKRVTALRSFGKPRG